MDLSIKPGSEGYFNKIIDQFFKPVFDGHSTLIETIPKSGVRGFIRYMISYPENISNDFANKIKQVNIVWVGRGPYDNNEAFVAVFSLIKVGSETVTTFNQLSEISQFILNSKYKTLIIINQAEQLLNDNRFEAYLSSLYDICGPKLLNGFIATRELTSDEKRKITIPFTLFNTGYVPLKGDVEMELLIEKEILWNDIEISEELKQIVIKESGGYSTLARALLEELKNEVGPYSEITVDELVQVDTIKDRCELLFECLTPSSQRECFKILLQLPSKPSRFITETQIVCEGKFFSTLFERFLIKKHNEQFNITEAEGNFSIYDTPLQKILSPQQFLVVKLLIRKNGEVVSREEVAKSIWGNQWSIEYSDWAIDSLIRNLRKNLMLEKESAIKTIKNKGFIYSTIS